jgi:hypothetical protein
MKRREFLKRTGAATLGAATYPLMGALSTARAEALWKGGVSAETVKVGDLPRCRAPWRSARSR